MRSGVALLVSVVALVVLSTASSSPYNRVTPTAVAFADRMHGLLGLASAGRSGAIESTADGGKTWHLVRHTQKRVVATAFFHDAYYVQLNGGATYETDTSFRQWRQVPGHLFKGSCPPSLSWSSLYSADLVDRNTDTPWSVCVGQPGAGNQAKAVYRGKKRVAFTPMASHGGSGGISTYGYPLGIAGTHNGFGIIWESRGTLYVSRNGGHDWHALPKVAQPEIDFGVWADVVWGKLGFVLLMRGRDIRLIETTDAGRTWHVVHRWK